MAESVEMHDVGNIPNDDGSNGHGENAGKMDGKVDVSKTGRDAAEMKKLKLFCVILLVMIIVSSGTIGALIYTLIATINDFSSRLAELETESTSDRDVIEMQNISLIQLEANLTSQTATIYNHNLSLIQIKADIETDHDSVSSLDSRMSALETNRALDSRLTYLEDGLNCTWGSWTEFSTCSAEGTQYRDRVCGSLNPDFSGLWRSRKETVIQSCNPDIPIEHGGWSSWSSWSSCTRSCNGGEMKRNRKCSNPTPSGTGRQCLGNAFEVSFCNGHPCPVTNFARDCSGVFPRQNGTYRIYSYGFLITGLSVYCEFNSDGVWTVIQRRIDGSVDFYRDWTDYKTGFGNVSAEYWLGNDVIHQITTSGSYKLKVILTDWNDTTRHAVYTNFSIANEADGYRLTIDGYSGNAGDSMTHINAAQFTTRDDDNDNHGPDNCAVLFKGAWWYYACSNCNLNGVYHPSASTTDYTGIFWGRWHGSRYSLKTTTMMIRRTVE